MSLALSLIDRAISAQSQVVIILSKGPNKRETDKLRLQYERAVLSRLLTEKAMILEQQRARNTITSD